MKQFWDKRYSEQAFAYGTQPNHFFKEQINLLPVGKALFPAEGEGRNAVYAATLGWQAAAFDISEAGKNKAMKLAAQHDVAIEYLVQEWEQLDFKLQPFDAMALIYAHFPGALKSGYHKALDKWLRIGATVIFEAFSKHHLQYLLSNPSVGGPKDIDVLFSIEEIQADFSNYDILLLHEKELELHEGAYHNGLASVIQFVGRKKFDLL